MLVFINALADPVLLAIDSSLLALGEVAVVRRHVFSHYLELLSVALASDLEDNHLGCPHGPGPVIA